MYLFQGSLWKPENFTRNFLNRNKIFRRKNVEVSLQYIWTHSFYASSENAVFPRHATNKWTGRPGQDVSGFLSIGQFCCADGAHTQQMASWLEKWLKTEVEMRLLLLPEQFYLHHLPSMVHETYKSGQSRPYPLTSCIGQLCLCPMLRL